MLLPFWVVISAAQLSHSARGVPILAERCAHMAKAYEDGICPNHGLVRGERKTDLDEIGWVVTVLSLFDWSDRTPFRCPKCGRLTEKPDPAEHGAHR